MVIQTLTPAVGTRQDHSVNWFGHERDFESLVQGHLAVLYRVARRMGCTAEEAEDTVQNTLVKAYRAWGTFDGRHLRSWLIRILRNERLMVLRSKNEQTTSLDESEPFEIPDEPFWDELGWKLQAEKVVEELQALPEIYKLAIQLCDVEEMSYEDAAEAMDIPIGTVRSRLFRARAMLRQRLQPYIECPAGGSK